MIIKLNGVKNSFYIVCYVLKYRNKIKQDIGFVKLRDFMHFPVGFMKILLFKKKKVVSLILWIIALLPSYMFIYSIRCIGKMKNVF